MTDYNLPEGMTADSPSPNDEPSPTNCEMYQRGRSMHFNPPSGRSFWGCVGELDVTPCPTCEGEGHHDSCFDCGNRGYTILTEESADRETNE